MTKDRLAEIKRMIAPDGDDPSVIARELVVALEEAVSLANEVHQLRRDKNQDGITIRTLQQQLIHKQYVPTK